MRGLKEILGFDPDASFDVEPAVIEHTRSRLAARAAAERAAWQQGYDEWRSAHADRAALLDRLVAHQLPEGWTDALPTFPAGKDVATRAASGNVLSALASVLPELWAGRRTSPVRTTRR